MKISYDSEVDALYICIKETEVSTKHLAEGIAIDYDKDGNLAGIEILDVGKRLGDMNFFRHIIAKKYRRKRGADTWHFCSNCSTWPTSNYKEAHVKPTSGVFCNECRARESDNTCRGTVEVVVDIT